MAKATLEIRSLARAHTETALKVLAGIMGQPDAPASARVQAAEALLNRGWGKPTQPVSGDEENPVLVEVALRPTLSRDEWLKLHGIAKKD